MTTECAVCYVSDLNFLLPSIVSAAGVRKFVPTNKADIFIFTVGVNKDRVNAANDFLSPQGIQVLSIDTDRFADLDKERLTRTHTPMAMFGRLFMQDLLPPSCKRIVYIDGDMWIERDPTALIDAVVPEGYFAAADDTIYYRQNFSFGNTAKGIKHYFNQLGLNPKNGYFNSGIFATSRESWKQISQEAYRYYIDNAELCEHSPDQSALNAVIGNRRLRLSSKWNFQTQLKIWGADRYVTPYIYHFNRFPKPWMGICAPWLEMYAKYQEAIKPYASLNLTLKTLSVDEIEKYNQSTTKSYSYLQLPFVSKIALGLMRFREIERTAWL